MSESGQKRRFHPLALASDLPLSTDIRGVDAVGQTLAADHFGGATRRLTFGRSRLDALPHDVAVLVGERTFKRDPAGAARRGSARAANFTVSSIGTVKALCMLAVSIFRAHL